MIKFKENLYRENYSFKENSVEAAEGFKESIPTSADITGIELRLTNLFIKDNHTIKTGIFPGNANLYVLNVVIADQQSEPLLLDLDGFEKVNDMESLHVNRTLYYWKMDEINQKPPSQIHVFSSIIKSKEQLRNFGNILSETKNDGEFTDITKSITALLSSVSGVAQISKLILEVAGLMGKYLGKVQDRPLFSRYQSFTDLGGDFNHLGKLDFPASNKYCDLNYTLFLRDKERPL